MKVIRNSILPLGKDFAAINLFGILFAKKDARISPELINHEKIHTAQMREMLYLPFYLIYLIEWLWRLIETRGKTLEAYRRISFEREAYAHGADLRYLTARPRFAQWKNVYKPTS